MRKLKVLTTKRSSPYMDYNCTIINSSDSYIQLHFRFNIFTVNGPKELEREILLNYADYDNKVIQLNFYNGSSFMEFSVINIFDYVDRYSKVTNLCNNIDNDRSIFSICRIIFDEDIYIAFFNDVKLDNTSEQLEELTVNEDKTMTGNLLVYSSLFAKKHLSFTNKANMLNEIDPYNSLAYLECQVDVLTRIVKALIPQNEQFIDQGLQDIITKADEFSVLDIKLQDKVITEFNNKQHLRQLQQRYYNEKAGTN